jgi:hypothetical protein
MRSSVAPLTVLTTASVLTRPSCAPKIASRTSPRRLARRRSSSRRAPMAARSKPSVGSSAGAVSSVNGLAPSTYEGMLALRAITLDSVGRLGVADATGGRAADPCLESENRDSQPERRAEPCRAGRGLTKAERAAAEARQVEGSPSERHDLVEWTTDHHPPFKTHRSIRNASLGRLREVA